MTVTHAPQPRTGSGRAWSPAGLLTALVLAAWAGLFWFLLATERSALYLSARTDWVVPLGAVILTVAAIGSLLSARTSSPEPLAPRRTWGLGLLILPVVIAVALPPSTLGSYAAARRSSFIGGGFTTSAEDLATGELTLIDLAGATRSREGMAALSRRAGASVDLTGFVVLEKGAPADELLLTRFIVSCCAADALSVQVRVVGAPPGTFENDDWINVTGRMYPLGQQIVVDATEVQGVGRPKHPYITP